VEEQVNAEKQLQVPPLILLNKKIFQCFLFAIYIISHILVQRDNGADEVERVAVEIAISALSYKLCYFPVYYYGYTFECDLRFSFSSPLLILMAVFFLFTWNVFYL